MCKVRNTIMAVVVLFGWTGLGSFASAGTMRHDRADSQYLALGALYPSVGSILLGMDSGVGWASGTLIDDDWVLTAAHVVDQANWLNFTIDGNTYTAEEWIPYRQWKGDLEAGYDIGLIKLDSSVPGVQPAQRYRGSEELGAEATFVGYGMTGDGLLGMTTPPDGQKRAGQNVIDVLYGRGRNQRLFLTDFDNPDGSDNVYGSPVPLDLEFLVAFGDSGGGVFIEAESGPLLAGVNSFIGVDDDGIDGNYGDISGHTRVSAFNRWIDRTIAGRGRGRPPSAGPPTAFQADPQLIPEPATLGLLVLGGLVVLKRRK